MEDQICLQDEIDDINLATRLSLLDQPNQNQENPAADEDEELARAIQESLKSSSKQRPRGSSSSSTIPVDCDVCNEVIPPDIPYGKNEFWNQKFCYHHIGDGTPICCACRRLRQLGVEYLDLGENRRICPDCYSTSTKKTQEIDSLVKNVLQFFKQKGMEVKLRVPIFLVTRAEMARLTSGGTTHGPIHPDSMIYGLTMHISPCGRNVRSVTSSAMRGREIIIGQTEYVLSSRSKFAITVLFGLPMVMTGAILAHEMMHAWLGLQGVGNLDLKVAEGICQVMGHEWLDWFECNDPQRHYSSREQTQFARNLKQTFKHFVEIDSSLAYGDGFRDAKHSVARHGLKTVLSYITKYGTLPR